MVTWTDTAQITLQQIHDYIARETKYYANKVTKDIINISKKLRDFPYKGRMVPESNREEIREVFIYSYRMIYKVASKDILILRILHQHQNMDGEMFQR